jgi:YVTN family beta-propeller protein
MKRAIAFTLLLAALAPASAVAAPLPGMPPVIDSKNIYSEDGPNNLSPAVKGMPQLVYVPNFQSATVSVIDPKTYKVIKTIKTKAGAQHVVPSWDLKTLWVNDNKGNYLTPIDPMTATAKPDVYVHDPYNLYFTPNGMQSSCKSRIKRLYSAIHRRWQLRRKLKFLAPESITPTGLQMEINL